VEVDITNSCEDLYRRVEGICNRIAGTPLAHLVSPSLEAERFGLHHTCILGSSLFCREQSTFDDLRSPYDLDDFCKL